MSINKNELELLSAGYLAAAHNDQDKVRVIVTKMAFKFDHWITILQVGALLSLESIGLDNEKVHGDPVKNTIDRIGWHGHRTTYSRLNTALVTLRGKPTEINRLKDANTKGEVMASMLTVPGQIIFTKHEYYLELLENEAREHAANTLEAFSHVSENEKGTKRSLAANALKRRRKRRAESRGIWDNLGQLLGFAADIIDIFT
jgi:hypothetical protein